MPVAPSTSDSSPRRRRFRAAGVVVAIVLVATAALCIGRPVIAPWDLPAAFSANEGLAHLLVAQVRSPRLVLGLVAGAALGAAGLLVQEGLRNQLAVPELLGVSSGAATAVAIVVVWGLPVPGDPAVVALIGALIGGSLCLVAANRAASASAVLLTGAAVSAGLQALLVTALSLADQFSQSLLFRYLVGNLSGTIWDDVTMPTVSVLLLTPIVILAAPSVAVLRLGDDTAAGLGLDPARARMVVLGLAAVLVAAVIPACGPIAWISFVAPMVARRLAWRPTPLAWLGWSAVVGGLVTVGADVVARSVLYPVELPVGALTAAVAILVGAVLGARERADG